MRDLHSFAFLQMEKPWTIQMKAMLGLITKRALEILLSRLKSLSIIKPKR